MKRKILFLFLMVVLLLAACVPGANQPSDVDQIVQATFVALTVQAGVNGGNVTATLQAVFTPIPTSASDSGSIAGNLNYPSQGIPPLLVVAFNTSSSYFYWVQTAKDQNTYQIDNLPPGKYHVFAYALPDGKLVGAYDQFYVCGMHQGCNDSSLIDVEVQAGVVTQNINPGDWYGDPAQWPSMPDVANPQLLGTQPVTTGSIAGSLMYPSSSVPSMTVVAINTDGSGYYYYVITNAGAGSYQIDNIAPGNYYVVAYVSGGLSGGYSQAVPCGLQASCADHSLIPVEVRSNEVTNGISPSDWYAPAGTFPASPLP